MKALISLTLPSKSSEMVPHTFLFDEERLVKLRSDMQSLINIEICMYLYRSLEPSNRLMGTRYAALDDTRGTSFASSPYWTASPVFRDSGVERCAKPDGVFPLQNLPQGARSWIMRILSLLVKCPVIVRVLYCCHQTKGVVAESIPTATSSASLFTSSSQTGLYLLLQERPAVLSTALLLGTTLWLVSGNRCKNPKLLPNLTAATTAMVFYLTMDDTCWPGQLAIATAFGIYLDFMCVQKQMALLEKTWAMTCVGVFVTGIVASFAVAYYNDFAGKYAHPAVLAGSVCLPVTVSASVTRYAFVKCTGAAENLERGDYNRSIFAFPSLVYKMFVAIMESMIERPERRRRQA